MERLNLPKKFDIDPRSLDGLWEFYERPCDYWDWVTMYINGSLCEYIRRLNEGDMGTGVRLAQKEDV